MQLLYKTTQFIPNNIAPDSPLQAAALAKALQGAGVRADLVPLNHVEHFGANERVGEPGDITTVAVERFLDSLTNYRRAGR